MKIVHEEEVKEKEWYIFLQLCACRLLVIFIMIIHECLGLKEQALGAGTGIIWECEDRKVKMNRPLYSPNIFQIVDKKLKLAGQKLPKIEIYGQN